jgi:hypothetical protein
MNRQRWGTPSPALSRMVRTLGERRAELDEPLKAELAEIAGVPQNEAWARTWRSQKDHAAERAASAERVDRMLLEAELRSAVERRDTPAVMDLISRLSHGGPAEARQ